MSKFLAIRSRRAKGTIFLRDIGQYLSPSSTLVLPIEKVLGSTSVKELVQRGDIIVFHEHKPHVLLTVSDFMKSTPKSTPISTPIPKEDSSLFKELQKFATSILGSIAELKEEVKNIKATTIIQNGSSQNGSQISSQEEHDYDLILDKNLNITSNLDNAVKQVETTANDMSNIMDALMKNKKG